MNAKQFVIRLLILEILISLLLPVLFYFYDSYQIFHKPFFREPTFHRDMRVQAKGIIELYDFDSFIVGTSMLENTPAKYANENLGGKWVNVSMSGSTFKERSIIMDFIFKNKNAKQIIYSLDPQKLSIEKDNISTFDYLYKNNFFKNLSFYYHMNFVTCALINSKSKKCIGEQKLNDLLNNSVVEYKTLHYIAKRLGGFDKWIENKDSNAVRNFLKQVKAKKVNTFNVDLNSEISDELKQYLQAYIIDFVKNNPKVEFHFVIPAYSMLYYSFNQQTTNYVIALKYLLKELSIYKNAKIYGFDTLGYSNKIEHYYDSTHYEVSMNLQHIDSIKHSKNILDSNNVDSYIKDFLKQVKEYDISPFVEALKNVSL